MPGLHLRSTVCALAFALLWAAPAGAADADSVAAQFRDAVAATERATVTYGAATGEGSTVTLAEVAISAADGTTITVPSLVFSGIETRDQGGFIAAEVVADFGSISGEHRSVTWQEAAFEQVTIPSTAEIAASAPITPFLEASVASVSLSDTRLNAPLAIETVSVTMTSASDGSPAGLAVAADGFAIPVSLFSGTVPGMLLQLMQYQELVADIAIEGTYDAATETGVLQRLSVNAADAGTITIRGAASGLAIAEAASPDDEVSKAARANARLDTLSVRLDNAGFVERMLDAQADMLGGTRDDIRAQLISGALPLALSFVKNEPFRQDFLAAATEFLQNPVSLTIAFNPAEPVPLGQFLRTLSRAPASVPDLLSPTVEANTAEQP